MKNSVGHAILIVKQKALEYKQLAIVDLGRENRLPPSQTVPLVQVLRDKPQFQEALSQVFSAHFRRILQRINHIWLLARNI